METHLVCILSGFCSIWSDCQACLPPPFQRLPVQGWCQWWDWWGVWWKQIPVMVKIKIIWLSSQLKPIFEMSSKWAPQGPPSVIQTRWSRLLLIGYLCRASQMTEKYSKATTSRASLCKPRTWRPLWPSICFSTLKQPYQTEQLVCVCTIIFCFKFFCFVVGSKITCCWTVLPATTPSPPCKYSSWTDCQDCHKFKSCQDCPDLNVIKIPTISCQSCQDCHNFLRS